MPPGGCGGRPGRPPAGTVSTANPGDCRITHVASFGLPSEVLVHSLYDYRIRAVDHQHVRKGREDEALEGHNHPEAPETWESPAGHTGAGEELHNRSRIRGHRSRPRRIDRSYHTHIPGQSSLLQCLVEDDRRDVAEEGVFAPDLEDTPWQNRTDRSYLTSDRRYAVLSREGPGAASVVRGMVSRISCRGRDDAKKSMCVEQGE